jgi:hypothetical protein
MPGKESAVAQARYELRISGRLSDRARQALGEHEEIRIMSAPPETIIYLAGLDEEPLRGVLDLLADLGLHLVSLDRMPDLPP